MVLYEMKELHTDSERTKQSVRDLYQYPADPANVYPNTSLLGHAETFRLVCVCDSCIQLRHSVHLTALKWVEHSVQKTVQMDEKAFASLTPGQ